MTTQQLSKVEEDWDLVLHPRAAWWDLRLGELWHYRGLIFLWVWREFAAMYQQTILGPVWSLFGPIFGSLAFMIFFNQIARISTGEIPPMLFYLPGMMIWGYFSNVINRVSVTLSSNKGLFGKVYFPRLVMPISVLFSALLTMGLSAISFLAAGIYFALKGFEFHFTWWALAVPVYILITALMAMGLGLIVTSLTTRYRDLNQLVGAGLQLMQYATPIVYPTSLIPDFLRPYVFLNPMLPVVEGFRFSLLGSGIQPNLIQLLYAVGFTLVSLCIGLLLFNRAQSSAMDTV